MYCFHCRALDKHNRQEIEENRRYVTYIVNTIVFLGRQGLALRGSDESSGSFQRGNFLELVDYTSKLSPEFASLKKKMRRNATYLSPEIQNELITLIADETKDTSHQEQLCVTLRYLKDGNVVERFVGFHPLEQLNARFMAEKITKVVSKVVPMDKCVAQVYDGAAVMKGQKNGVNAIISQDYPKALYLHCQSHVLNLCLVGTVSSVQEAEDVVSMMVGEMKSRFSNKTLQFLRGFGALEPMIMREGSDFLAEARVTRRVIMKRWHEASKTEFSIDSVMSISTDLGEIFPYILSLYELALTIGCSSASCERSFSAMKRVKSYLRSSMTEERLHALSVINIENQLPIDANAIVLKFAANDGNRRLLLY
ncbi:zinc finger MYM-type protein 1-like [Syngnathus acus]|uniref:zinc finger MYM-type protein 1-like n=1 Tax=Syngnathus acus TaxID=161584 RepID=UPI0018861596|nr:zinc finger MYM-type protein 1-like [Syngnathus acus]XP_037101596.1 zinc finger MYM-type protein 1-like [Syngnathus acus]